jgi:hypothetical protein
VRLVSNDLEFFLRENLGGIDVPHPNLLPEAFSYSFVWPDAPDTLNPRIVVARSYVYDEALFLDFSCDYRMSSEESSIHFDKNFTRALAELRLERADEAE